MLQLSKIRKYLVPDNCMSTSDIYAKEISSVNKNVGSDEKVTFLCSLNLLLFSVLTQNPLLLSTVALFSDDPVLGWC